MSAKKEDVKMKGMKKSFSKRNLALTLALLSFTAFMILPLYGESDRFNANEKFTLSEKYVKEEKPSFHHHQQVALEKKNSEDDFKLDERGTKERFPDVDSLNLRLRKEQLPEDVSRMIIRYVRAEKIKKSLFNASLVSLIGLHAADYFSTTEALKYSGLKEANPVLRPVVKNSVVFAALKLGYAIWQHNYLKKLYRQNRELAWVVTAVANVGLSIVVAHNLKMIQEKRAR